MKGLNEDLMMDTKNNIFKVSIFKKNCPLYDPHSNKGQTHSTAMNVILLQFSN